MKTQKKEGKNQIGCEFYNPNGYCYATINKDCIYLRLDIDWEFV